MRNPWASGYVFDGNAVAWCDAQSRIDAARRMTPERLIECLAWPDTQKTVRLAIERMLRKQKVPVMRCSLHATCQAAADCAAGRPHLPDREQDGRNQCYDHKPYVDGGVTVWGVVA
jgi:hypothetical protein